jgi:hypothetical protein
MSPTRTFASVPCDGRVGLFVASSGRCGIVWPGAARSTIRAVQRGATRAKLLKFRAHGCHERRFDLPMRNSPDRRSLGRYQEP